MPEAEIKQTKTPAEQVVEQPLMKLLGKYKGQISALLPQQFNAERVLKLIVGAINKQPELLRCTPISVVNAILTAALARLADRRSTQENKRWGAPRPHFRPRA